MFDQQLQQWRIRQRFWTKVPGRSLAVFMAAAFFTFATFGLLVDLAGGADSPRSLLAFIVAFAGTVAMLYAWAAVRRPRLIPLVLLLHVSTTVALNLRGGGAADTRTLAAVRRRLAVEATAGLVGLSLGYLFFLRFVLTAVRGHAQLQTEMGLAQEIHAALVPPLEEKGPSYEAYGRSFPTSEVGGDMLDLVTTADGTTCYVADVSGHGVPAGILMSMVKSSARMRLGQAGSLGEVLADLNRVLIPLKEAHMYATCACLRMGARGAEFALAGHLPILHYQHRDARVSRLSTAAHLPLGLFEEAQFAAERVELEPGDVLAILTDGLTEVADARGDELGVDGIETLLAAGAGRPLPELFHDVLAAVRAHGPQRDDQTLLLIRMTSDRLPGVSSAD
jgi:stage II sporulation SpoE-like protein